MKNYPVSNSGRIKIFLHRLKETALHIVFPSICLSCNKTINTFSMLCATCWKQLSFVTPPYCYQCGDISVPNHGKPEEILCLDCSTKATEEHMFCRSVLLYNHICRNIIHNFKLQNNTSAKLLIARWLYMTIKNENFPKIDLLLPVPLHANKIRTRGFNQTVIICQELHKISKIDYKTNLIIRHKNTKTQGNLNKKQRYENVQNAFSVNEKLQHLITDRNILIVDDLRTTGATLLSCAQSLKPFKPRQICGITIARA